ncbi:hypothetical protein DNTS_008823, partial [Danionella cerebrum]
DDIAFLQPHKVSHRCSYLDERNIILSPHLLAQPRLYVDETIDSTHAGSLRLKVSPITRVCKSPKPDVNLVRKRGAPLLSNEPINPTVSVIKSMFLNKDSEKSTDQTPVVEANPESHEENHTWRCVEFLGSENPETVRKRTSIHKSEWLHLPKPTNLGLHSPRMCRHGVLKQGFKSNRGQLAKGPQKQDHKDRDHRFSGVLAQRNWYGCLYSPLQCQLRNVPGEKLQDTGQKTKRRHKGEYSETVHENMDIWYQSGWRKNSESPLTPHHITFSHILQVLQYKETTFPDVKSQKCHRTV